MEKRKNTRIEQGRNIPALRFPGFGGEWEKKKLGEISTTFSGGTPLTSIRAYFDGDIPFIKSGEIDSERTEQYISEDAIRNSSAKLVNKGDLLYALYGATSGEVAISKIDGAINQAVLCVRTSLNNYFAYTYLVNNKNNIVRKFLQGGQGNLSAEIVKSFNVMFPTLPEQQKIANFFTAIDQKISQLKKKHQLLEQYKKGVMQKIFSQQIRFKPALSEVEGDDDGKEFPKWEKKLIKDILEIKYGKDQKQISCDNGKYPILGTGGEIGRTNEYLTEQPSVLIGRKGTIDKPVYIDKPFWTVDTLFYTNVFKTTFPKWLYYKFCTVNWYLYNEASGVPSLSASTIYKIPIHLPSFPEQTKIANFLSAIDDKIQHTQKQVEQAEQWKKGLMQRMFA